MSPIVALLIIGVAMAIAVGAMLLVRRHAPEGSVFDDGDRAAGGFGVLATGFSVLLGLIVFLAFTSYDDSRRTRASSPTSTGRGSPTGSLPPSTPGSRPSR